MVILPIERYGRGSFADSSALRVFACRSRLGPGPTSLLAPSPLISMTFLLVQVTNGLWGVGRSDCGEGLSTEQSGVISQFKL